MIIRGSLFIEWLVRKITNRPKPKGKTNEERLYLLIIEVFLIAMAVTSDLEHLFPVFLPILMCVFGYLLCKIATGLTFKSVVKAIQKELILIPDETSE